MNRVALALAIVSSLCSSAWALPVGGPGFSLDQDDRVFAITGGVGYTYRLVEGDAFSGEDKQDVQQSFRFLIRAEAAVLRWITPSLILGYGDRTRSLIDFEGTLSPIAGLGLRLDPLIQKKDAPVGIAVVTQFSYEPSNGLGTVRVKDANTGDVTEVERQMNADTWHYEASVLITRKDGRAGLYAGPKFDYDRTVYSKRSEAVSPSLPFGIVVGVDYDITPEVFFTAEMENFHQDAIYALVGGRF